jgi:hypothetical protein
MTPENDFPEIDLLADEARISRISLLLGNMKKENKTIILEEIKKMFKEVRAECFWKIKALALEKEKLSWSNLTQSKQQIAKDEAIIVEAKEKTTTIDELKKLIDENLKVVENGIKLNGIKKSKDKIIINVNKEHHEMVRTMLIESINEKCVIRDPIIKDPQIIIKNIEKDLNKDEITNALKNQNRELFTDDSTIKLDHVFGKKEGNVQHIIITTDKEARKKIIQKGSVYIGYISAKAETYIPIMQCSRCSRFGHKYHKNNPAKQCKREWRCLFCGDNHDPDKCPMKNQKNQHQCINCSTHNKNLKRNESSYQTNHKSTDKRCQCYQQKFKQQKKAIELNDY